MNASIKSNKRLKNRVSAAYVHSAPVTTKRKDQHAVSQATTMVKMAKVAKAKFSKNCLSNVASSHLKRGSFELANAQ